MSNFLRLGIVQKQGRFCVGAGNVLPTDAFDSNKMKNVRFGWIEPYALSTVGSASYTGGQFVEAALAPTSNSIRGVDFEYVDRDTHVTRYFASASSTDVVTALQATDANEYTLVAVLSPYTTQTPAGT